MKSESFLILHIQQQPTLFKAQKGSKDIIKIAMTIHRAQRIQITHAWYCRQCTSNTDTEDKKLSEVFIFVFLEQNVLVA